LEQNYRHIGQHHRSPHNADKTDPVLPLRKRIDGDGIVRTKKKRVDPDRGPPPGRPGYQHRVELMTIPMHEVNHSRGRPQWIPKMIGVGNDQLLDVDDVSDKKEIDAKENN